MTVDLMAALRRSLEEHRDRSRQLPEPFYVHLPVWAVFGEGVNVAAFITEFNASRKRVVPHVAGFEVEFAGGTLRYTSPREQR